MMPKRAISLLAVLAVVLTVVTAVGQQPRPADAPQSKSDSAPAGAVPSQSADSPQPQAEPAPRAVPSQSADSPQPQTEPVPRALIPQSPDSPPLQKDTAPLAVPALSNDSLPVQVDPRSDKLTPLLVEQPNGIRYVVNPVVNGRTAFEPVAEEEYLRAQSQELARALESERVGSPKYEAVKTQLRDLLGKQFDKRQARHKNQIEALEAQVKKLREVVQKRQENREDIVSRRLDLIIRESQGLGF
jgi:hypothetical protein